MNISLARMPLRLAIPVIALTALAVVGEPVPGPADAVLAATAEPTSIIACEDTSLSEAEATEVSEQRSRTAMRLRWALTLPDSSRPLSISLLP